MHNRSKTSKTSSYINNCFTDRFFNIEIYIYSNNFQLYEVKCFLHRSTKRHNYLLMQSQHFICEIGIFIQLYIMSDVLG